MNVKDLGKLFGRELMPREKIFVKNAITDLQNVYDFGEVFFYKGYLFFIKKVNYVFYIIVSHQLPKWGSNMVKYAIKEEVLEGKFAIETIKYFQDKAIHFIKQ